MEETLHAVPSDALQKSPLTTCLFHSQIDWTKPHQPYLCFKMRQIYLIISTFQPAYTVGDIIVPVLQCETERQRVEINSTGPHTVHVTVMDSALGNQHFSIFMLHHLSSPVIQMGNSKLIVCKRQRFQVKAHHKEDINNDVILAGAGVPLGTKSLTVMVSQIKTQIISKRLLSNTY